MERVLIGVTKKDKVSNTNLRLKSGVQDIISSIKSKKWRWAGHLARRCDNRWTVRLTNWTPRTYNRGRGRQKMRWRDELTTHGGIAWQRVARDRSEWSIGEEAFVLQWKEIG